MKFGKTDQEWKQQEQEWLEWMYNNPRIWFAWYPVKLESGQWIWWERVLVRAPIGLHSGGYKLYKSLGNTYEEITK